MMKRMAFTLPVFLFLVFLAPGMLLSTGCNPEEEADPYYSDDIGMEAEPIEEGAMAGTFAL